MRPAHPNEVIWTPGGVRLTRIRTSGQGKHHWLFVPGGPGLGSESLAGLAEILHVPGTGWLVDLPGEGTNRDAARVGADPFRDWPAVLAEATADRAPAILVGHSTGGMFALATDALRTRLAGLVLIGSAPHDGWRATFARYAAAHPIAGVDEAAGAYARQPDDRTLRDLTMAAAPWNFTPAGLAAGRAMVAGLPVNHAAAAWADENFDDGYRAAWVPQIPTLILSGTDDHIVDQQLWTGAPGFDRPNITQVWVDAAAHFPWIDNPDGVRRAVHGWFDRSFGG